MTICKIKCEADLLRLSADEALAEVNKLLTPLVLVEKGNQADTIVVLVKNYAACATNPYQTSTGRIGGCSILDFLQVNNILGCVGRDIEFRPYDV